MSTASPSLLPAYARNASLRVFSWFWSLHEHPTWAIKTAAFASVRFLRGIVHFLHIASSFLTYVWERSIAMSPVVHVLLIMILIFILSFGSLEVNGRLWTAGYIEDVCKYMKAKSNDCNADEVPVENELRAELQVLQRRRGRKITLQHLNAQKADLAARMAQAKKELDDARRLHRQELREALADNDKRWRERFGKLRSAHEECHAKQDAHFARQDSLIDVQRSLIDKQQRSIFILRRSYDLSRRDLLAAQTVTSESMGLRDAALASNQELRDQLASFEANLAGKEQMMDDLAKAVQDVRKRADSVMATLAELKDLLKKSRATLAT